MSEKIQYGDFSKVDIRVGTILEASELPNAREAAWVIKIDFGEFGVLKSSAQITAFYSKDALIGKQVMAVVNLEPRQVGSIMLPISLVILMLMTWVMTPMVKGLTLQQVVFTYFIPIIPICYAWDGQASMPRAYAFKDLEEIINGKLNPLSNLMVRRRDIV